MLAILMSLGLIGCKKEETNNDAPKAEASSEPKGEKTEPKSNTSEAAAQNSGSIRVVSGRKESLVGPLFVAFEKKTGIKVEVDYGKTPALAMQLLSEGDASPADVFYAQDSGYLGKMKEAGLLEAVPSELRSLVRAELNLGQTHWLAVSGRARVLVYDPAKVPASELPASLKNLVDPRWKSVAGWAPGNSSFQAHLSALRHHWGEEATAAWVEAMKANDTRSGKNNSALVKDVERGAIQVALVNHYYTHKLGVASKVKTWNFPSDDGSNVVMISGAAVLKHSKMKPKALALLNFLVSDEAQAILAVDNYEYPARSTVREHPNVAPLKGLKMTPVKQESLTDVGPTLKLLQKAGLN
jgi:iron(III) transport system substrate-binding protein